MVPNGCAGIPSPSSGRILAEPGPTFLPPLPPFHYHAECDNHHARRFTSGTCQAYAAPCYCTRPPSAHAQQCRLVGVVGVSLRAPSNQRQAPALQYTERGPIDAHSARDSGGLSEGAPGEPSGPAARASSCPAVHRTGTDRCPQRRGRKADLKKTPRWGCGCWWRGERTVDPNLPRTMVSQSGTEGDPWHRFGVECCRASLP